MDKIDFEICKRIEQERHKSGKRMNEYKEMLETREMNKEEESLQKMNKEEMELKEKDILQGIEEERHKSGKRMNDYKKWKEQKISHSTMEKIEEIQKAIKNRNYGIAEKLTNDLIDEITAIGRREGDEKEEKTHLNKVKEYL